MKEIFVSLVEIKAMLRPVGDDPFTVLHNRVGDVYGFAVFNDVTPFLEVELGVSEYAADVFGLRPRAGCTRLSCSPVFNADRSFAGILVEGEVSNDPCE